MSLVFCKRPRTILVMARSRSSSSSPGNARSNCPIACALDLIGDKWTLLVVRDLFAGKRRFGEFQDSPEGIPTNILSERLSRLEEAGLISSEPYQQNPTRYAYSLSPKGEALRPVLATLAMWGRKQIAGTQADKTVEAALSAAGRSG